MATSMSAPTGVLQTRNGLNVQGDGGPISVPPNTVVAIGKDGTVSTVPPAEGSSEPSIFSTIGRHQARQSARSSTHAWTGWAVPARPAGGEAEADMESRSSGMLEGSNVNVVDAMVDMISLSRQFEMHMKLLQNAEGNSQRASTSC